MQDRAERGDLTSRRKLICQMGRIESVAPQPQAECGGLELAKPARRVAIEHEGLNLQLALIGQSREQVVVRLAKQGRNVVQPRGEPGGRRVDVNG